MHTLDTLLDAIYDGGKTYISRMHALQIHSWTAGQAHQPRITAKARLRKAKTLIELHDGGRSRRERALVRPSARPSSIK